VYFLVFLYDNTCKNLRLQTKQLWIFPFFCRHPDDGCTLIAETCSCFCTVNKQLCLDWKYYVFYCNPQKKLRMSLNVPLSMLHDVGLTVRYRNNYTLCCSCFTCLEVSHLYYEQFTNPTNLFFCKMLNSDHTFLWSMLDDVTTCFFFQVYQQDATLYSILYYCQCSTCFRRFLRPSSGAQKLYTQHRVCVRLACCYR